MERGEKRVAIVISLSLLLFKASSGCSYTDGLFFSMERFPEKYAGLKKTQQTVTDIKPVHFTYWKTSITFTRGREGEGMRVHSKPTMVRQKMRG